MLTALLISAFTVAALADAPLDTQAKLVQLESSRSAPARIDAFSKSEDPDTRMRAARSLGRLRTAGALSRLKTLAVDPHEGVRQAAAFALSQTPSAGSFARQRLPEEPSAHVRAELFFAIGLQGTAADLPVLLDALAQPTDDEHTVDEVAMAAQAIGQMSIRGIWQATAQPAIQRLVEQHRRPDNRIRRHAAFSLARINTRTPKASTALALIKAARTEPDATAQAWFVRATGGLQNVRTDLVELYTQTARDPAPGVRIATVRAGAQAGWTGVAYLLDDPDPEVRMAAIEAVGKVKGLDTAKLLGPVVKAGASLKPPETDGTAIPPMLAEAAAAIRALDQPSIWAETETARYSRVQVGLEPSLSQYLSQEFSTPIRMAAASINPDSRQLMRVMAEDGSPAVRIAATERLLGGAAGTQRAIQFLASRDTTVQAAAAEWLANKPTLAAEAPLLRLASQSDSVDVVRAAATALARLYTAKKRVSIPAKNLVPGLMGHSDASIRASGAALARSMGMPGAGTKDIGEPGSMDDLHTIRGAIIQTAFGTAVVQLYPTEAPLTVQNFARLADEGFFDGLTFHRVVPDFVVQGGDPRGDGWGGPGYSIPDEVNPIRHEAGALGMALTGRDTAGSQWYATLSPQPHLDGKYTVFGQVTQGLHVLRSMLPGDRIEKITIERVDSESKRHAAEQAQAKKMKDKLAARVKPRKKSDKAKRLLKEYYSEPTTEAQVEPESAPAAEPEEPSKDAPAPANEQGEDPKDQEPLPAEGEALPEDHQSQDKKPVLNEGEKVEFGTAPDEQ